MVNLSLREAQLFRMLTQFFGHDRVVLKMSVLAVCGGELPRTLPEALIEELPRGKLVDLASWAKRTRCLFTIVDQDDSPRLVVDFFSGFEDSVDAQEEENQRMLGPLLSKCQIPYVTISDSEFGDLLDPTSSLDFCTLLEAKFSEARTFDA
jgi:hypothetical protein